MRILILGAGKMGSFFTDILSFQHETAVYDTNPHQLRFVYNTYRFTTLDEIKEFEPELVINAVTVKYTLDAFRQVLPVLPKDCIISDIASVKTGLKKFYTESGFRYVSTHPMFGPTFASLSNLSNENAIIITEGDHLGRIFFKDLYQQLKLNIFEYTFDEHDETVAYSLSIPFVSTFVFAAVMKHQEAPGTTFKPIAGNPVQPPHPRPGGERPTGAEAIAGDYHQPRCRGDEEVSDEDSGEDKIKIKWPQQHREMPSLCWLFQETSLPLLAHPKRIGL